MDVRRLPRCKRPHASGSSTRSVYSCRFFLVAVCGVVLFIVGVPIAILKTVNDRRTIHVESYLRFVRPSPRDAEAQRAFAKEIKARRGQFCFELCNRRRIRAHRAVRAAQIETMKVARTAHNLSPKVSTRAVFPSAGMDLTCGIVRRKRMRRCLTRSFVLRWTLLLKTS